MNVSKVNIYGDMVRAGIASQIPPNATAAEAAKLAGLDWQMVDVPLAAMPQDDPYGLTGKEATDVFGRWKVYDDGREAEFLATIGQRTYQLPNATLLGVFDPIVADGRAEWLSVGGFNSGAKVWGQVKMTGKDADETSFRITDDDYLAVYPTCLNFNDGTGSAGIGLNLVRIACQNTFKMATKSDTMVKLRHSQGIDQRFAMMAEVMHNVGHMSGMVEKCRFLASKGNITTEKLRNYIITVFGMETDGKLPKQSVSRITEVTRLFEAGICNKGQTWWDATNAITEFFTHNAGRSIESRMNSLWFGQGGKTVDEAFNLAVELATAA